MFIGKIVHDFKMVLSIFFYQELSGKEPVREWLHDLEKKDRKTIGEDIKRVQFGWPLGMPLVRSVGRGLWEIRSTLDTRIARIIFAVYSGRIILLHGFIKKSRKMPPGELALAKKRFQKLI